MKTKELIMKLMDLDPKMDADTAIVQIGLVPMQSCHFCFSKNVVVRSGAGTGELHVHCDDCNARGPGAEDFSEAIRLWNENRRYV